MYASDVYLDYIAVMSSIDIIRQTRDRDWLTPDLRFEDDLIDLAWPQREFEYGSSFAYTVMNREETECLGCFYFYKPSFREAAAAEVDVDINFWVTQTAYDKGLYVLLYTAIQQMIEAWPLQKPHWSNKMLIT